MNHLFIGTVLLAGLFAGAAAGAATDPELAAIRDGLAARVRGAFKADSGKPLVRAEKRPPLRPGRGNYVRHYSFSIVEFATRCLFLGEMLEEANAALAENAQHYLDHPADINDRDSFHWHSEMLCRLVEQYGARGAVAEGRMTPETEALIMQILWLYAKEHSKVEHARIGDESTWSIHSSENHHVQRLSTSWHFARLAKDHPEYRDREYDDGLRAADHYAAWTEYVKDYCRELARRGLFVEFNSENYNVILLKGLYNFYDFSDDPEVRRLVGMLFDLYWAMWAQQQIDGILGGPKARIYQTGRDRLGGGTYPEWLGWFYFEVGNRPRRLHSPMLTALTSAWRPPLAVVDIARDVQGRGRYAVVQRPLGLAVPGFNNPPDYIIRTDESGIVAYSWCTPDFVLGTPMVEPRPWTDWVQISSQNRWSGAIFAGHPHANIVPQVRARDDRVAFNAHWSVQSRGTLIVQKLPNERNREMRVWFSGHGLSNRVEENGWVFVEAPQAYAAVRPARGGYSFAEAEGRIRGDWLTCLDEWTPVILEVASKEDFADYGAFRRAVGALPMSFEGESLSYRGLGGEDFVFHADRSAPPEVDGQPVDYAPPHAFHSPFVRGEWGSGVVEIGKDGRILRLDFNAAER